MNKFKSKLKSVLPSDQRSEFFAYRIASVALFFTLLTTASAQTSGPLRQNQDNPAYFADANGKAVYLTGSHTWNSLQDMDAGNPPSPFDFDAYLDFLERHHHNFIRLWRWEQASWDLTASFPFDTDSKKVLAVGPHPWARTGEGSAFDGKPKFNLEQFDPEFFERLLARVQAANKRGIYVSVMLFEGWELSNMNWISHPFNKTNNVNGINGDPNDDGKGSEMHTLAIPAVLKLQEAYVRHVIDTIGQMDNVLFEIANESGDYSTEWQYYMIRYIKNYEATKPKQHPVGMTFQWAKGNFNQVTDTMLFESPADWISPRRDGMDGETYRTNPPVADSKKVILLDTDHLWGIGGNVNWVWKSFLRGYNPIFMDPYDNKVLGKVQPQQWDSLRQALGQTRRLAERLNLARMKPLPDLASSKYCLADPGNNYVVFVPEGGRVSVNLSTTNELNVEWIQPVEGTNVVGKPVMGGETLEFKSPLQGASILYLHKNSQSKSKFIKCNQLNKIL